MTHTITVQPSGKQFEADEGETILAAAMREGIILPYGCRNGVCGSCKGKVVTGQLGYPEGLPAGITDEQSRGGDCLFCKAVAYGDATIEAPVAEGVANLEVRTMPCRVDRIEKLNHDVARLWLKLPKNDRLQFLAGQYLEFLLPENRKRAFSMANAPHDDDLIELHIRHVEGGLFTDQIFGTSDTAAGIREKSVMRIRAPLGTFYLREDSARPIILVAGGTGFAPIKGVMEHALHSGIDRPIHLFWGVRQAADLYLPELPVQWAQSHANVEYTPVLSDSPEGQWEGARGFVHEAVLAAYPDLSAHDVYMCGPPVMITSGRDSFIANGLPEDRLYYDSFEYAAESEGK
ncbi:MAG: CDP-6-deoxy-delta-3,4-glucoseen reductase [Gammaproteobacteria bacterium]